MPNWISPALRGTGGAAYDGFRGAPATRPGGTDAGTPLSGTSGYMMLGNVKMFTGDAMIQSGFPLMVYTGGFTPTGTDQLRFETAHKPWSKPQWFSKMSLPVQRLRR